MVVLNRIITFSVLLILSIIFIIFSLNTVLSNIGIISVLLLVCAIGTSAFILSGAWYFLNETKPIIKKEKIGEYPTVALVCTFSGEDVDIVKKVLMTMKSLNYPKNKINIYLLDDSNNKKIQKEMEEFCKKNNILYIKRKGREGFKAGNVNNFLFNYCKEEYLMLFDKDDFKLVNPNIILDTLPFFKDKEVAYVQTKKTTTKGSLFENAMKETNALFYNLVQPINDKTETALFGGSLALMRVDILKKLGGMQKSLIEDVAYSFKSLFSGFKGRYLNKNYVLSNKIESFSEFQKQHYRYNFANTKLLFDSYIPNVFKIPFSLHYHLSLQFFGLHFLSLSQVIACILLPIFMIYLMPSIYLSTALVLFVFLFPISILLVGKEYSGSFKIGFIAYLVNHSLAFTRMSAAAKAVLRVKPTTYRITGIGKKTLPLKRVIQGSLVEFIFFILLLIPLFLIPFNPIYIALLVWNASLFLTTPVFLILFG